jgi:hypothetical protein
MHIAVRTPHVPTTKYSIFMSVSVCPDSKAMDTIVCDRLASSAFVGVMMVTFTSTKSVNALWSAVNPQVLFTLLLKSFLTHRQ